MNVIVEIHMALTGMRLVKENFAITHAPKISTKLAVVIVQTLFIKLIQVVLVQRVQALKVIRVTLIKHKRLQSLKLFIKIIFIPSRFIKCQ